MQAPMNEYYTDEEYQYALKQMYRMMERNRILAQCQLAKVAKNQIKKSFDQKLKTIARDTKATITSINNQMDTAIQGKVRKSLETKIPNMLVKFTGIKYVFCSQKKFCYRKKIL